MDRATGVFRAAHFCSVHVGAVSAIGLQGLVDRGLLSPAVTDLGRGQAPGNQLVVESWLSKQAASFACPVHRDERGDFDRGELIGFCQATGLVAKSALATKGYDIPLGMTPELLKSVDDVLALMDPPSITQSAWRELALGSLKRGQSLLATVRTLVTDDRPVVVEPTVRALLDLAIVSRWLADDPTERIELFIGAHRWEWARISYWYEQQHGVPLYPGDASLKALLDPLTATLPPSKQPPNAPDMAKDAGVMQWYVTHRLGSMVSHGTLTSVAALNYDPVSEAFVLEQAKRGPLTRTYVGIATHMALIVASVADDALGMGRAPAIASAIAQNQTLTMI